MLDGVTLRCRVTSGCHFRYKTMSGTSGSVILLAVALPSVALVIVIIVVGIVLCRRYSSNKLRTNLGEVSDVSGPIRGIRRGKRPKTVYLRDVLHTPPVIRKPKVWTTRKSKRVYSLEQRQSGQSDAVVERRPVGSRYGPIQTTPTISVEVLPGVRTSSVYKVDQSVHVHQYPRAPSTSYRASLFTYL